MSQVLAAVMPEPGEPIELDAVDFCRILAGRVQAPAGPLETIVPF